MPGNSQGTVYSVSTSSTHSFSKDPVPSITLIAGLGIQGDAHAGVTVQHRSRLHIKPPPANLRQVHLIPLELLTEVSDCGQFEPGDLGENVTTIGIDLKQLGKETKLLFVDQEHDINGNGSGDCEAGPVVVVMGLRNPCPQIDKFRSGLRERLIVRDEQRKIVGRLAGVMGTVEKGGEIRPGMRIRVQQPAEYQPLECV
ncbi:hypothetical protein N7510_002042 [Penicillium lagena]|uniref:uncharacterized protein n=1 Tax=Penicillium lagena TaxID=94218 RepID=UPI00254052B8|nr:uncharacterized protein N7510_002042 [Penicillium lagena]KAJ5625733.1 hypothetical protein N7510_002042 [Penicillium lagena]